jgi:hypothetical protein
MNQFRTSTLATVLDDAANSRLEDAWVYFRDVAEIELHSECLVVFENEEPGEFASSLGFPLEGLDTSLIEDCIAWAKSQERTPSPALQFYAFRYYWRFDAFPPFAWAPDPPPASEIRATLALEFYRSLGPERPEARCKHEGCANGAIRNSVLCRVHHYEMIRREPCPFAGEV